MSIPTKNHEYLAFVENIKDKVTKNATAWVVPKGPLEQLTNLQAQAQAAYKANSNPETKNRHSSEVLKFALAELKPFVSRFTNLLLGLPRVPDDEIAAMGLRPRRPKKREPSPAPHTMPELGMRVGERHETAAFVSTLQHGHPTQHLTDSHVHYAFILRYRFEGETDWKIKLSVSKRMYLTFADEDVGKFLHAQAAWLNRRLEMGPWSEEAVVLIN